MKRHEINLNAYCWLKAAHWKRLHTAGCQPQGIWKRHNRADSKKVGGCQRLGGGAGVNRQSPGELQDSEITRSTLRHCDAKMMNRLAQPTDNTKSTPSAKLGTLGDDEDEECQWRSARFKKCTTQCGVAVVNGAWGSMKNPYLHVSFAVNLEWL